MAKLTVAKINEIARGKALEEIKNNGLTNFLQIEGTKFAKDFTFNTEEGNITKTVRIDIVVPKLDEDETAETLAEDYKFRLDEKAEKEKEKEIAKAKKIARDSKKRAEKKANESNPVIKRTVVEKGE